MKLKPLDKVIKSHYRRCCPLCGSSLHTDVVQGGTNGRIVRSRCFTCRGCKSSYCYDRDGSHFKISSFQYRMDKYEMNCTYDDKIGFQIIYDPEPDNRYVDNIVLYESDKLVPFPSTKEKLEDRLQLYITFS